MADRAELGNEYFRQVTRLAERYPDQRLETLIRDVPRPPELPSLDELYHGAVAQEFFLRNHRLFGLDPWRARFDEGDVPVWASDQCDLILGIEFSDESRVIDQINIMTHLHALLHTWLEVDEIIVTDIIAGSAFWPIKIPKGFARDVLANFAANLLVAGITPTAAHAPTTIVVYQPDGSAARCHPLPAPQNPPPPLYPNRTYRGEIIASARGSLIKTEGNPFDPLPFRDQRSNVTPFVEGQRYKFAGWWEIDSFDGPVFIVTDAKMI